MINVCFWQLFWEKKLSGLNAFDIAEELVKTMDLPKGLQGTVTCGYVEMWFMIYNKYKTDYQKSITKVMQDMTLNPEKAKITDKAPAK